MNKKTKNLPLKKKAKEFTLMQLAFCHEMVLCPHQTNAAIKAGYSAKSARQKASKLMTNANIREKIEEIKKANWDKSIMTRSEGLAILSKMGRADITKAINDDGSLDMKEVKKMGQSVKEIVHETIYEGKKTTYRNKVKITEPKAVVAELSKQLGWALEEDPDEKKEKTTLIVNVQNNFIKKQVCNK